MLSPCYPLKIAITAHCCCTKPRFHFEIFWPKFNDFLEAFERGWQCPADVTNAFKQLDCLIQNVTKEFQSWSAKKTASIKLQLLVTKELVLRLDTQDTRMLSLAEEDLRKHLKKLSLGLASLDRTIARQRSRILYLSEGDANTRLFHIHANGRRCKKPHHHHSYGGWGDTYCKCNGKGVLQLL